jgi:hypothetical protein
MNGQMENLNYQQNYFENEAERRIDWLGQRDSGWQSENTNTGPQIPNFIFVNPED